MTPVPATVLVLIVGSELIHASVDRWFNAPMDEILASANQLAGDYYQEPPGPRSAIAARRREMAARVAGSGEPSRQRPRGRDPRIGSRRTVVPSARADDPGLSRRCPGARRAVRCIVEPVVGVAAAVAASADIRASAADRPGRRRRLPEHCMKRGPSRRSARQATCCTRRPWSADRSTARPKQAIVVATDFLSGDVRGAIAAHDRRRSKNYSQLKVSSAGRSPASTCCSS